MVENFGDIGHKPTGGKMANFWRKSIFWRFMRNKKKWRVVKVGFYEIRMKNLTFQSSHNQNAPVQWNVNGEFFLKKNCSKFGGCGQKYQKMGRFILHSLKRNIPMTPSRWILKWKHSHMMHKINCGEAEMFGIVVSKNADWHHEYWNMALAQSLNPPKHKKGKESTIFSEV